MNKTVLGLLLRLLGILIELPCVILLVRTRGEARRIAGLPLEYLLSFGILAGFLIWFLGVSLPRRAARQEAGSGDAESRP